MKFIAMWKITPENRDRAIARFKETGGAPPAGVKMVGRWHDVSGRGGVVLCETDDATKIARWMMDWTDLLSFELTTVINDEEFTRLLS